MAGHMFGLKFAAACSPAASTTDPASGHLERSCWPGQRRTPTESPVAVPPPPTMGEYDGIASDPCRRGPAASAESSPTSPVARPTRGRQEALEADLAKALTNTLGPWLQEEILQTVGEAVERATLASTAIQAPPEVPATLESPPPTLADIERCVEAAVRAVVVAKIVGNEKSVGTEADEPVAALVTASQTQEPDPWAPRSSLKSKASMARLSSNQFDQHHVCVRSHEEIYGIHSSSSTLERGYDPDRPTLLANRVQERKPTLGEMSQYSVTTAARTHEEANKKAIVVNFRRLSAMKESLRILQLVIRSLTIALLALLSVRNQLGLYYNLAFLCFAIALYALHESKFNIVDIEDFKRLSGQLGNDGQLQLSHSPLVGGLENPNRYLQAVSFSKWPWSGCLRMLLLLFFVFLCCSSWIFVGYWWTKGDELFTELGMDSHDVLEMEHYITLTLVGTCMLFCHLGFELVYWRETRCVMPPTWDGQPWDISEHGTPPGCLMRILGLPCIWFSTSIAHEDLRTWVTLANAVPAPKERQTERTSKVFHRVCAEELALYALEDTNCASQLRNCLLHAKLFDKRSQNFLCRTRYGEFNTKRRTIVTVEGLAHNEGEEEFWSIDIMKEERPTELGVELLFYDSRTNEVWVPRLPEETDDVLMPEQLPRQRDFLREMLA